MGDPSKASEEPSRPSGAEEQFRALVEQVPAILYVDRPLEGVDAVYVSPQVERILGISAREWTDPDVDPWATHLHPDDQERVLAQYADFLKGGPDMDDYRMVRPDGRTVWIRDRSQTIRNNAGEVTYEHGVMMDVTELKQAHALVQQQVDMLERVDAVGRKFANLALRGADMKFLLQALADIGRNPVVLEDAAHQLIEFAVHGTGFGDVLTTWGAHSRNGHEDERRGIVLREEGDTPCLWVPIWLRDELWGRLHLLEMDTLLDEIDRLALDRAAAAIGMSLLSERDASSMTDRAGGALLSDILRGRYSSAEEVLRRAQGLGADLQHCVLFALVVEPRVSAERRASRGLSEGDRQRVTTQIVKQTRGTITGAGLAGLVAPEGDRAIAIVGMPSKVNSRTAMDDLGDKICAQVAESIDQLSVVVGVSDEAEVTSLGRALESAGEAASYGARTTAGANVVHFRDLGVQHLLALLSEGPELARFVESELSPLLKHDAKSRTPLLPTLRVILENGGRKQPSARALHIERRTIYHRIDRIEQLLARDLDDHETRVKLEVALSGLSLLQVRTKRHGGGRFDDPMGRLR